ncbi:MAG: adenylate kinase [Candidatus Omnitrophica bacterium]|nr:adenylate kinase [Candidatus Omnitrophota bacterium]
MRIILFGAPGSGKGTQAVVMSEYYKAKKVSLGDILREEVKKNSELGAQVKSYMEKGLLVPDELVSRVIEENIDGGSFILDGYPRNAAQAAVLDSIMKRKKIDYDAFIYLDVNEATLINRLSKRLVCKRCGANYHLINMPPKTNGICDKCSGELIQRKDDTPEVIKKRLEVFVKESKSILDFYQKQGKLIKVDASNERDEVFSRIKKILK